ncbi:MAG: FAD-binding oxidoreductase [Caldisericum exile]|uniref:FAD-binding oxidoreductase n=1 Tax=Caldisericum exile TaxID=693075 RepID=A0A2J6X874_9BACT|nr:MAG: FAD-binding oxidoreductase [Caldisericum exile]
MKNYDVLIVGGGITGLSTAYYLVRNGVKNIAIVEKSYVGSGSTGRCGTGIRQQFTTREHIVLMREAVKIWQYWEESLPLPIHFRQGGYIWLLRSEEALNEYKSHVKLQNLFGVPSKIISKEEIKEIVPDLSLEGIVGASWCPTDGSAYPQDVLDSLRLFLKGNSVEVFDYEEVKDFELQGGKIKTIITSKDKYGVSAVLFATGNETKRLASKLGFEIPIENYKHQIVVSEPLKIFLSPMVVDSSLYFTQTYRGRIIGGTDTNEPPQNNLEATYEFLEKFSNELLRLMPRLASVRLMRQWAGYYVVSPDKHPIIGPTPIPNLYIGTGYSGHGFMLGPIVGKLLAHYITHGMFFLEEANNLTLSRFKEGKLIVEKAVIG